MHLLLPLLNSHVSVVWLPCTAGCAQILKNVCNIEIFTQATVKRMFGGPSAARREERILMMLRVEQLVDEGSPSSAILFPTM